MAGLVPISHEATSVFSPPHTPFSNGVIVYKDEMNEGNMYTHRRHRCICSSSSSNPFTGNQYRGFRWMHDDANQPEDKFE